MNHGTQQQLDKNLRPFNAPSAQGSITTGFSVAQRFQRDTITTNKIRDFNFSQGHGGTLTLGGTANGSGLLSLQNASGTEIIHMDNSGIAVKDTSGATQVTLNSSGITVNNGSISVTSNIGSIVLDSKGIYSLAQFNNNDVFNGALNGTTASTSYVDVSGGVLGDVVLTRTTNVLLFIMGHGYNNAFLTSHGADYMFVGLYDSFQGTVIANTINSGAAATYTPDGASFFQSVNDQMVQRIGIVQMAAGTHSLKVQFKAVNGGTAHLTAFEAGYVILGT